MFSTEDKILNPVTAWATVIKRVRSYPDSTMNTKVCEFHNEKGPAPIKADQVRIWLRDITEIIGEAKLGFTKDDVGLHSIRSGAAMAMFISGISPIIIQRVGRWSSDAFLRYIRKRVEQFSHNISTHMIRNESYFTTPDFQPAISRHDTRTPNDPTNFATRFIGGGVQPRERFALCA